MIDLQRAPPPALTLQWPTLSSSCFVQAAAIPLNHSNLTFRKIIPPRLSCLWTLLIYFPFYGSVDLLGFGSGPLSPPGNSSPINLVSMSCLPVIKNKLILNINFSKGLFWRLIGGSMDRDVRFVFQIYFDLNLIKSNRFIDNYVQHLEVV